MATANSISQNSTSDMTSQSVPPGTGLLVLLASMPAEQLDHLLANLASAFPNEGLLVATPDAANFADHPADQHPHLSLLASPPTTASWTLTAADFVNAYALAQKHGARGVLLLGAESASLQPATLRTLAEAVLSGGTDLAVPCYDLPPLAGLVNSAILYPLTRGLFASRTRFPLAIDLGLSLRMAERLAAAGQRFTALNQSEALVWPVDEASTAGFTITELDAGPRTLPQPTGADLNAVLALVTGSLFADIDLKAAFWQRARPLPPARTPISQAPSTEPADIGPMLDAFRLAYTNLQEIWSLVLPPNTLLGLKRLSVTDPASFRMPDALWARTVFDFLLAYRLRTINRGHLLGALTPLYLAWVASHINITTSGTSSEGHIEAQAAAFEADKPYLVSRWRWPDRFNP